MEIQETGNNIIGKIEGRLDTICAMSLDKDFKQLAEKADKSIIIDCSKLEYVCSSGLRLFLMLHKAACQKGGSFSLTHVNDEIAKIFKITGLATLLKIQN